MRVRLPSGALFKRLTEQKGRHPADEDAVLKTAGVETRFRVRVPGLPLTRIQNHQSKIQNSQSCGPAAKAPVLQTDDRRFESVQDYF